MIRFSTQPLFPCTPILSHLYYVSNCTIVFSPADVLCPNMKVQPDRFKPNSTSYGLEEVPGMCKHTVLAALVDHKVSSLFFESISYTPTFSLKKKMFLWTYSFLSFYLSGKRQILCLTWKHHVLRCASECKSCLC